MFTRTGRPSWWAAAAAAAVLLTSACSGGATSSSTSGTDSIVIGALPVIDDVSAYIAADEGIYQRFGLNVTLKTVTSSLVAISQMQAGTINILGGGNYVSFIQEAARTPASPPFKILAEGATCSPGSFNVLALSSSGIQTPASLAHKTIAVNIPNNIQTLTINSVLAADGVNPATVRYVVVPFPKMGAELKDHKVDAISAVEPFATEAEQASGAEPILDQCSGPTSDIPLSGYFSTSTWAQQHPDVVKRFQEAIAQAQEVADTNRLEVEKTLVKYVTGLTPEEAGTITLEQFPTSADAVQLNRVSDLMREAGLLGGSVQAGTLIQG
jgi:NitT/TauT family transport system substrate-binding protein